MDNAEQKVIINKAKNKFTAEINGRIEGWMRHTLLAWVIVWSSLGVYVAYYLVNNDLPEDQTIFFSVYLAFWLYFEFKSIQSLLYKSRGVERITIDADGFAYHRSISKKKFTIPVDQIRSIDNMSNDKSFGSVYSKSFWIIGGEAIEIKTDKGSFKVGIQLEPADTKRLLDSLRRQWKHYR